jgi:hypothetical protein
MKSGFKQLALLAINEARMNDGNEAMPKVDHTPDWIAARGVPPEPAFMGDGAMMGSWYADWMSGSYGD